MKHGVKIQQDTLLGVDVFHITDFTGKPRGVLMSEQDAQLFCEAETVHFDIGLTPGAVLSQRDKLADLLEQAMEEIDRYVDDGHPHWWTDAERLLDDVSPTLPLTSAKQCLELAERLGDRVNDPEAVREELQRMEVVQ